MKTKRDFLKALCEAINNHYDKDFFCFCGDNPLSNLDDNMIQTDKEKAEDFISIIKG